MSQNAQLEAQALSRQWFYRFRLPSGRTTATYSYVSDDVLEIHDTRERMLTGVLDRDFGTTLGGLTAVDLACHEGFFSHTLVSRGCREVVGIDARPEHVANATLMRDVFGYANLRFVQGDLQRLTPAEVGRHDISLLFGILYHLENVVGVLRLAQAVTRRLCLIETQVAPNLTGVTDWGSFNYTKQMIGCLAIVDETSELAVGNTEANTTPITLFPSLPGLLYLLKAVGFTRAMVVPPFEGAYEQLASGKRVIVAAYNDSK